MGMGFHEMKKLLKRSGVHSPTLMEEQRWLVRQVRMAAVKIPSGTIVECGTMNGNTVILMANCLKTVKENRPKRDIASEIISIDNYSDQRKHDTLSSFDENVAMVKEFGFDDVLTLIEGDDIEFLGSLDDHSVSLLWVDSCQSETHVYQTLQVGLPKMMRNSLVCGHDYIFGNMGVPYALDDFYKDKSEYITSPHVYLRNWWFMVREVE